MSRQHHVHLPDVANLCSGQNEASLIELRRRQLQTYSSPRRAVRDRSSVTRRLFGERAQEFGSRALEWRRDVSHPCKRRAKGSAILSHFEQFFMLCVLSIPLRVGTLLSSARAPPESVGSNKCVRTSSARQAVPPEKPSRAAARI